jgi:DNA-binding IclR family transcriptional regulator
MGKAALAFLPVEDLQRRYAGIRWLPTMTARSHRTVDALLDDLAIVRERGYAMDDEETMEGVVCFGVAFPGRRTGEGPYAVSCTILKIQADERRDPIVDDLGRLAGMLRDPLRRPISIRG